MKWKERVSDVFKVTDKKKIKLETAAEFSGKDIDMLEAHRKQLYGKWG